MRVKPFTAMDILRQTIAMALLLLTMFPIYWMISTSLKPTSDILVSPPRFFFQPTLEHYTYAFQQSNFGLYISNTLIVALSSTIIVVATGTLASYSFARYNVGGGNLMFFILTTRMMPAIAVVLPFFVIFKAAGESALGQFLQLGQDRLGTLVVCYTIFNLPFAIFVGHSFFGLTIKGDRDFCVWKGGPPDGKKDAMLKYAMVFEWIPHPGFEGGDREIFLSDRRSGSLNG